MRTAGQKLETRSSPTNPTSDTFPESKPRRKSESSYSRSPNSQGPVANNYQYLPYADHAPQFSYYNEQLTLPWQSYQQLQTAPYFQLHTATLDKKVILYKTEMCRTFEETGTCKYGAKCQFAHDPSEIRTVPRHPRYKTEICKTFWQLGNCPYGKRCCFIHTENELRDKSTTQKVEGNTNLTLNNDAFGSVDTLLIDDIATEAINSQNSSRSTSPAFNDSFKSQRAIYRRKSIIEDKISSLDTQIPDKSELSPMDPEIDVNRINQAFEVFWSSSDSTTSNSESNPIESKKATGGKYVLFNKSPGSRAIPISKTDIWSESYSSSPFLAAHSESEVIDNAIGSGSSSRSSASRQHLLTEMINLLDSQ